MGYNFLFAFPELFKNMSDGRKRLSGAAYRKAASEKVEKQQETIRKTAKIYSFFRKGDSEAPRSSSVEAQHLQDTTDDNDDITQTTKEQHQHDETNEHQKDSEIDCRLAAGHVKTQDVCNVIPQTSSTTKEQDFTFDPALWPINDNTREKVITTGINQDISNLNFSNSKRFIGGQNRYLTQALFTTKLINGEEIKRSYLMYSETSGKLFCIPCQLFGGMSKLATEGFDDWKHCNDSLKSHENSSDHKSCVLAMKKRMATSERIDSQLVVQVEDEKMYWRNVLKRVVAVVQSLAAAGLPLRGHCERFGSNHNCGNFIMCIELIAQFDPFLATHVAKYGNPGHGHTSYLSFGTYEEILKLMAEKVTNNIICEIKAAKYFSLIIDSTPDISHVDQLAVIIRFISEQGIPVERFLCFLPNVGHKAEELLRATIDALDQYGVDIKNCRGQAYDNASNMSGAYTGLQARIRVITPSAIYVPCSAHSLNLVGEHSTSSCRESCDFFMLINNLYNFFSASTKRWERLTSCLNKKTNLNLKSLSKTRWSARDDACKALNEDWQEVIEALNLISNDVTEKASTRSEASSYVCKLQRLETAFLSILWGDLLNRFNITSKKLQSSETDLSTVAILYGSLSQYINSIRQQFDIYENGALLKSEVCIYDDEVKRKRRRKLQPDETEEGEITLIGRDNFKINTFYVILDTLSSEMEKRKAVYDELSSIFGFLIFSGKEEPDKETLIDQCTKLCTNYNKDLPSPEDFAVECLHLFFFLKGLNEQERPKSIFDLYKLFHVYGVQDIYPYVDIALKLFLTIPASNCSAERSFSVLKRIKTYTRSTMTEARLRDVAVLTIESETTKKLAFDDVINSFSDSKARRKLI